MPIGDVIKNLRIQKGYSQVEFADKIGESKQTLWKYETGVITNIPLNKIEKIAEALNVPPSDITGWTDAEQTIQEENNLEATFRQLIHNMTEDQQKILYEELTDEQKLDLIRGLVDSLNKK